MLIPNRVFPALVTHCDPGSSRYAFGGIYFERDKEGTPYAVATDSRHLIATTWTEMDVAEYPGPEEMMGRTDGEFSVVVPQEACKKAPKLVKLGKRSLPILGNVLLSEASANGRVPMFATNLEDRATIEPESVEGRFPKWRDVFPAYHAGNSLSVCIDPFLLAETLKSVGALATTDEKRAVVLTIKDKHSPVLVSASLDGVDAAGAVMPLDSDKTGDEPERPAWLPQGVDTDAKPEPTRRETRLLSILQGIRGTACRHDGDDPDDKLARIWETTLVDT